MSGELTFRRLHEAPRALVFECMTTPEHLTRFWGPAGTSTPLDGIVVELRVGGRFETMMVHPDGSSYVMRAVYTEVDPPSRLGWRDESGMRTTVTFAEVDGNRTEVLIHQVDVPAPALDPAAQAGFLSSLDRFDAYLAAGAGADADAGAAPPGAAPDADR